MIIHLPMLPFYLQYYCTLSSNKSLYLAYNILYFIGLDSYKFKFIKVKVICNRSDVELLLNAPLPPIKIWWFRGAIRATAVTHHLKFPPHGYPHIEHNTCATLRVCQLTNMNVQSVNTRLRFRDHLMTHPVM